MKTDFLKLIAIVIITLNFSCSSDDETTTPTPPTNNTPNISGTVLQGDITTNLNRRRAEPACRPIESDR